MTEPALADVLVPGRLRVHIAPTYPLATAPRALSNFCAPHVSKLAVASA